MKKVEYAKNSRDYKKLYACGEVATGLHRSNRLIGNSLLECMVFGAIVGSNINNVANI